MESHSKAISMFPVSGLTWSSFFLSSLANSADSATDPILGLPNLDVFCSSSKFVCGSSTIIFWAVSLGILPKSPLIKRFKSGVRASLSRAETWGAFFVFPIKLTSRLSAEIVDACWLFDILVKSIVISSMSFLWILPYVKERLFSFSASAFKRLSLSCRGLPILPDLLVITYLGSSLERPASNRVYSWSVIAF